LEFLGKGNVILCDNDDVIIDCLIRHKFRERSIIPKEKYKYPNMEYDVFNLNKKNLIDLFKNSKKDKIVTSFAVELGLGGVYSEEVCLLSNIDKNSKVKVGLCNIFAMHATAAIIINENADPNICLDTIDSLNDLIPAGKWRHDKLDGNADAHIKSTILGPSETIPITNGKLQLGTWQAISLVELDGPRNNRKFIVTVIP